MTEPHETPDEYEEATDRWLSVQHQHLVDHLDATLDVETGLQDILLHSQHAALVERLDTEIDVEANLAAIISLDGKSTGPETEPPPTRQSTNSSASSILPAEERIALRANLAVMRAYLRFIIASALDLDVRLSHALDRARASNLAYTRARYLARARARAQDLVVGLALDIDLARARALAVVRALDIDVALDIDIVHDNDIARARDLVLGLARTLARALAHDLERDVDRARARALVYDLARDVDRALNAVGEYLNGCRQAIEDALGCHLPGENVEAVEAFLDDFTDADLSQADLNGVDLTGVRWSESGTRWPQGMDTKALKQRSTSHGNGIWVVGRGGGPATVPDSVGVS